ncbi:VirK/YbjX family protein [Dyella sp. 2RAB6]|uniref:VirK/YbjX family protein n=1 Tax=Dyella sp. 2RAB6 TaxID=3232992 RepID=UPI003F8FEA02
MPIRLFLRSLRFRHDWRGAAPKRIASGLKYLLRCARMARQQSAWLQFVYGSPRLTAILEHDPRLLERWHHHYINRQFGRARRMEIAADHFRFVFVQLPEDMADGVYLHGRHRIGTLLLKDGSELRIELRRPTGRSREGEVALCLTNSAEQVLSSAVFTVADEGSALLIGCMQGASAELGREAVRELTKQCHGLRPKNLLFSLLLAFAAEYGIERVRGVANLAHPFAGEADKIKADYDAFWQECQGEPLTDGFYALPAQEPLRDETQVESKHRSAFRKREALRREACGLLVTALRGHAWPLERAA